MKTCVYWMTMVLTGTLSFSQGQINFDNKVAGVVVEPIYAYLGGFPLGPESSADLVVQDSAGSLTPLVPQTIFEGGGFVVPQMVSVGRPPGDSVTIRMRAWIRGTSGPSFEEASYKGTSNPFTVVLGGGLLEPANLVGLRGFVLFIPEPSPASIIFAGAAFFAFFVI